MVVEQVVSAAEVADSQWGLWEVFAQEEPGAPHQHAGSVHAVDAEQALQNARDVYARRKEAISLWVVPTATISASTPEDVGHSSIRPTTSRTGTRSSTRRRVA